MPWPGQKERIYSFLRSAGWEGDKESLFEEVEDEHL
jgi:hypothetical protein